MLKFKEQLKKLSKRIKLERKDIKPFIISLIIVIFFFLASHYFSNYFVSAIWIVNVILLAGLLFVIMTIAGFAVLKSLFLVAAELSLLIFLAQSYCAVPGHSIASNEALKSLLVFGILYIVVSFFHSLYKALKKNYKYVKNERWSNEKIVTVSLYLIFTVMFIWNIYLVIYPIIIDLCVYK